MAVFFFGWPMAMRMMTHVYQLSEGNLVLCVYFVIIPVFVKGGQLFQCAVQFALFSVGMIRA